MNPHVSPPHTTPPRTAPPRATALRLSMILTLLLGLVPLAGTASPTAALAVEQNTVNVVLHFKDTALGTVDFASYEAPASPQHDNIVVRVNQNPTSLNYSDRLLFAVYENYATFGNKQVDITQQCSYDAHAGTVSIPRSAFTDQRTLAIVFWLSPAHPAYSTYVTSDLDTKDLAVTYQGQPLDLQSDIPDVVAQAHQADRSPTRGPLSRMAAAFPGATNKHYRLNAHTRLENFDTDMKRKQAAYGFPRAMIGSYGFGVFFGSQQVYKNGVSTGTTWRHSVLNPSSDTYDSAVDAYLNSTIAARLGSKARFAVSRTGDNYRPCFVSTGSTFQDAGYSKGESPNNKAMAPSTCGSSNVANGSGALAMGASTQSYIAFKGVYRGSQSAYRGWYKFFYRIDAKSASTGKAFQDVVGYVLTPPISTGKAQAIKVSANPALSNADDRYSLKCAVIAAFPDKDKAASAVAKAKKGTWKTWQEARDWSQKRAAFTLVTKSDGTSNVAKDIDAGTYYVAELFAPRGFRLLGKVESFKVEARAESEPPSKITLVNDPQVGSVSLTKVSANPSVTSNNDHYSLAGAVYGVYTDAACLKKYGNLNVALDGANKGIAQLDNIPLGSYWVKEIKRPDKGYALDPHTYPITVTDGATARVNAGSVVEPPKLNPLRILLQKVDKQTGEPVPQGGASLGDAHFRVNYYDAKNASALNLDDLQPKASWLLRTNDDGEILLSQAEESFVHRTAQGETEMLPYKISGPPFFKLENGTPGMPLGTYSIQEVKAPLGYTLDPTVHIRHINDEQTDAETVTNFQAEEEDDRISNQVIRSDIQFTKFANNTARLANVPFKITSKSTGEWHILVTDENGFATTASSADRPHSERTNINDEQFIGADGNFSLPLVLDAEALDAHAGIWFAGSKDGEGTVDGTLGALPFDQYDIEELRCPVNQLFTMIHQEVTVDESSQDDIIDLGILNNTVYGTPDLETTASDSVSGTHEGLAAEEATIIDRVSYRGLTPGLTYTLTAVLMNAESGEPLMVDGDIVTADKTFTPEESQGSIDMELSFPASQLRDTKLVVFEALFHEDSEVALHADLTNEDQTVTYRAPYSPEEPRVPEPEEQPETEEPPTPDKPAAPEPEQPSTSEEPPTPEDAQPTEPQADEPTEVVKEPPNEAKQDGKTRQPQKMLSQTGDAEGFVIFCLVVTGILSAGTSLWARHKRHRP